MTDHDARVKEIRRKYSAGDWGNGQFSQVIGNLITAYDALVLEHQRVLEGLKGFAADILGELSDGSMELDYDELLGIAERHGLVVWKEYDPAVDGEMEDVEKGDRIWVRSDLALASPPTKE